MSSISLFGAGSWGTALAVHLAESGRSVTLWARRAEAVARMERTGRNSAYLPDVSLPHDLTVTDDLEAAAGASDLWGIAVPSQHLREVAVRLRSVVEEQPTVVSLAKGIENDSLMTMSQVLGAELGDRVGPIGCSMVRATPRRWQRVIRRRWWRRPRRIRRRSGSRMLS